MIFNADHKARFFRLIGYEPWERDAETGALLDDAQFAQARLAGRPTFGQKSFHWACNVLRFVAWFAGARSGKSIAGAMELAYRLFLPDRRIWIAAPNYRLGSREFEYVYKVYTDTLPRKGFPIPIVKKAYNPDRGAFYLYLGDPIGSFLEVRSDENPEGYLGQEIDDLLLAEAPKMSSTSWSHYLTDRLVTRKGNVLLPATPDGFNWAYDEFFVPAKGPELIGLDRSGNSSFGDHWAQLTSAVDCPDEYYPASEKKRMLDRLAANPDDTDRIEQFHGRFTHKSGLVFYQLKPKNIVTSDEARARWHWS